MLEVGVSSADSQEQLHIGAEYQAMASVSIFADLATGEDDYEHVLVGAKYYFGGDKSLIKRHREDDPPNNILTTVRQSLESISDATAPGVTISGGGDGDFGEGIN